MSTNDPLFWMKWTLLNHYFEQGHAAYLRGDWFSWQFWREMHRSIVEEIRA